ncbi:MAG TPA: flagellar hook-length control protein FliK [Bacteroidota bacterium]|nr:flagellar hook-length control protein FliK [Bacteroidota bacterium]
MTSTISSGQIIQGAAVDLLAGLSPQEGKNIQTITLPSPSLAKKVPNADVMPHGTMTSKSVADEGLSDITPTVATSPSATIGTNQGTKNRDDGTIVLTSTGQGNIGKQPAQNGGIENVKNAISLSQEQNNIPTSIPDGTDNIFDSLSKGIRGDAQPNPVTSNERVESAPFIAPAAPLTQNMQVEDVSEPKGITSREPIAQQVDSSSNLGSPSSTDAGEDNGAQQEISDQQISVPILRSPAPFIDAEAQRELPAQFGITGQTNLHSQYGREPVRVSDVERDGNVFTPRIATEIPPQEIDQPITPNENIPLRPAGFNVDDKSVGSKGAYNTAPAATSAQPQLSPQQTENVTLIPNVKAEPIKPAMNTLPVENPHQPAELPNDLIFDPETSSNAGKFESAADLPPMPLSSASRSIDQELGEKLPQALTPELSAKTHQREEFHPSSSVATAAENAETAVSPKEMAEQGGVAVQEMQTEVQSPELPVDIGLVNEEGQGEDPAVEMPTLKTSTATFTSVPPEIKAAKGENSPSIPTAGYLDQGRSGGTQSTSTALPVAQNEIDPINIRPDSAQNDTGTVPNAGAVGKMGGKNLSQAPAPKKTEASPVLSEISSPFKNQKEIEPENTIRHDGAPTPVNHPDVNGKIDKGEEPEAHVSAMNELAPSTEPAKNGTQGGNDRNSTSNGQLHSQGKISGAPAQPAEFDQAVPTPENVSSKTEPVISMASNNQNKNAGIPASQTELLSKLANQVSGLHSPSIAAFRSEPAVKGGSSASSPQAGLLPGNLEQSIMDQVSKSLAANFKNNSSEIRITMKPESLGEVTMKVKMDDGKVSAQIDVSNANVKAVLDTNVAQLRDTLLSKGIDVHRIDVVADGQTAFGGSSEESKSKRQANEKNASGANAVEQYESLRTMGYNTIELIM